ncbi:hypothetical protein [Pseudoroseicyclus aestuarii]|uniref:Uncharacterized protein n=1 Tax=Pseudoroseicyclus aestuarii TaxID=1795041 RepID=A0A318SRT1_9RHOB|nr:hypothetical protein [Pseudoroseicyclus aestuarii]PYE80829.1 hypothetical protein DFP88_11139 [Pseudoroseicyclus aestuarii]
MTATLLRPVDTESLPEYPVGREVRLNGQYFLKFETMRYLTSSMGLRGTAEVRCYYLELIFHSQHQVPIGTLPADRLEQARMLRVDPAHWEELCRLEVSPLHRWTPCTSDGELRLMHRVVLDTVQDQIERREVAEVKRTDEAVRGRIRRLRERMVAAGFAKAEVADNVLVERMEQWLCDTVKGKRFQHHYDAVFAHAATMRWIGGARVT